MERCQFKEWVRQNKNWSMLIDNHVSLNKELRELFISSLMQKYLTTLYVPLVTDSTNYLLIVQLKFEGRETEKEKEER